MARHLQRMAQSRAPDADFEALQVYFPDAGMMEITDAAIAIIPYTLGSAGKSTCLASL